MSKILEAEIPNNALSARYKKEGAFVDCYYIDIPNDVTLEQYIKAFYTTPPFKVERTILSIITRRSATDQDAAELALGNSERYSIWTVEDRDINQILLREFTGATRSCLMVEPSSTDTEAMTRLFFGSVVIPKKVLENGQGSFGLLFHLLGGFHKLYSKVLLKAAFNKLLKNSRLK
jgi:hypothetical protein